MPAHRVAIDSATLSRYRVPRAAAVTGTGIICCRRSTPLRVVPRGTVCGGPGFKFQDEPPWVPAEEPVLVAAAAAPQVMVDWRDAAKSRALTRTAWTCYLPWSKDTVDEPRARCLGSLERSTDSSVASVA